MKFRVTLMRDRGARIPVKELANREAVIGDLLIYQTPDEQSGRMVHVAALHGSNQTSLDLLPLLYDVQIDGMAPSAFGLRGFERHEGRRGVVDVAQEWWVRLP